MSDDADKDCTAPEGRADKKRLFFALWPDLQIRSELAKVATTELRGNGKRVPSSNLHLTLAFLGELDENQQGLAEQAADSVRAPAFRLGLDRLGFFDHSKVAWSGPSESDTKLEALANGLHSALDQYGLATELRLFRPHVTLARNVTATGADTAHTLVSWSVREFCLVHSVPDSRGAQYHPVNFWPLA